MQLLNRTSSLGTAYTAAQVVAQLFSAAAVTQYKFDQLNRFGNYVSDLTPYIDPGRHPSIVHDSTIAVKRAMSFDMRSGPTLAPLSDLIRPHFQLRMPDGGWIDFLLGVFTLLPPSKDIQNRTTNNFQATDLAQLLLDGNFLSTFSLPRGTGLATAVGSILSSLGSSYPFKFVIPDPGLVLAVDAVWEAGVSRLQAINDILSLFNYVPLFFDENGVLQSFVWPDFSTVLPAYTFDLMNTSAGYVPLVDIKDLSNVINQQVVIVERTSPAPVSFAAIYQNRNPLSEVSVVNWHPKAGAPVRNSAIPNLMTAGAKAKTLVQAASRFYEKLTVPSLTWPAWQDMDVCGLLYSTVDEGVSYDKFLVTGWTLECWAGAPTINTFSRIGVPV